MEAQYVVPLQQPAFPELAAPEVQTEAKQRPVVRLWTIQPCV